MPALASLLQDIRACTLCAGQLPLGPKPIVQIHRSARILVAAQAPGRRAHASGRPFDDASGDRLRGWMGLSPEAFYDPRLVAIVPMGFCFPGTGSSGDLPPRPECAPAWRAAVLAHLRNLELTLVLGRHAQAYHLPAATSLTDRVQDWRRHWPHTLAMPHPSPRNNGWLRRNPWFEDAVVPQLRRRVAEVLACP